MKLVEKDKILRALLCLQREMGRRRTVYPRFVSEGRMNDQRAATELADLQDAIDILTALYHHGAVGCLEFVQQELFGE